MLPHSDPFPIPYLPLPISSLRYLFAALFHLLYLILIYFTLPSYFSFTSHVPDLISRPLSLRSCTFLLFSYFQLFLFWSLLYFSVAPFTLFVHLSLAFAYITLLTFPLARLPVSRSHLPFYFYLLHWATFLLSPNSSLHIPSLPSMISHLPLHTRPLSIHLPLILLCLLYLLSSSAINYIPPLSTDYSSLYISPPFLYIATPISISV